MVLLKIAVKNNKLTKIKDTLMIEDTINGIKCKFEFRSDWTSLTPKVVFARGHVYPSTQNPETIPAFLDNNDECIVPPEIVSDKGEFSIGLFGENEDTRIVTNWLYYKTQLGCYDAGKTPNPPTPTMYDQILGALNNKSDVNHIHEEYITRDESDLLIEENVSQTIDEIFGSGTIDAGPIIERG